MRVATWNLNGLEERGLDARTEAAIFTLVFGAPLAELASKAQVPTPNPPDILLFQEVVERSLRANLRPHLSRLGYELYPRELPDRGYFEVLAWQSSLKVTMSRQGLPSELGRELSVARIEAGDAEWWIGTAHLESMREGARQRVAQAQLIDQLLEAHQGPALFAGDTNLRRGEVNLRARDAWVASGSGAGSWTWCPEKGSPRMRFDRVWVNAQVEVQSLEVCGERRLASGLRISDHLGLIAQVRQSSGPS